MKKTEDCFLKVKNDYLKFLNKEKILNKSTADKIENLKKLIYLFHFGSKTNIKKKEKLYFWAFQEDKVLEKQRL